MAQYEFLVADSLEKVFPVTRPRTMQKNLLCGLQNEIVSFQVIYTMYDTTPGMPVLSFTLKAQGEKEDIPVRMRRVDLVPSDFPAFSHYDTNYISVQPGLFPDLLSHFDGRITPIEGQYRSIWMDIDLSKLNPGEHKLMLTAEADRIVSYGNGTQTENTQADSQRFETTIHITVLDAMLPDPMLHHTQWFHADCLADYYHVLCFSERHWEIVENFIQFAGEECGINTILTPVFTQPLDTMAKGERTTVQLVRITCSNDTYTFDFQDLSRWCRICKKYNITHLEIAHFFTQWGAGATPKIMAWVDGSERKIFGWEVEAKSPKYRRFLEQFIPALLQCLQEEGYGKDQLFFHISDEPTEDQMEQYLAAKEQVEDLLEGCTVMDALSSYEFYQKGIVKHPIPANDHIQPFLDNQVPGLWVYYCCGQCVDVPNRFFSMPSARNRIMGVLLYYFKIEGFLHWGYNFYNSKYSLHTVNPYQDTHADFAFPSGDAFLVYPGEDGKPVSSIRNQVQMEALYDRRALLLLESLTDRSFVESLILEGLTAPLTFKQYPKSADWIIGLRRRVNNEIAKRI